MKQRHVWSLFIAAFCFLTLYITIAAIQNNFAYPNFEYARIWGFVMLWITPPEFQSLIWKLLLLFPSIILFSVAISRLGVHIHIPQNINFRLTVILLLAVAALLIILSTEFVFHETETTDDENAYDFQAQTLLAGRILNPPPPVERNFDNDFIIHDWHCWVGKYTLGHPAVIALGLLLGNRYIITIAMSILTLLLIYLITLELYGDQRTALLAIMLGFLSPFFYLVSSSRLSHTTSAFFLALFMFLFLRIRRTDRMNVKLVLSLLAGLSLGYAFNTRSLTALGFAIPFAFVMAKDCWKSSKHALASGIVMGIGFGVIFLFTLWYNAQITGNPFQFPFHYYSAAEAIGFGAYGHSPLGGMRNLAISIFRLNAALFGFPLSLLFVFIFIFSKKDFGDRLSFGILGGIAGLYFLYYSPGVADLGPVYYYETLIPLVILSARGILFFFEFLAQHFEYGKTFGIAFLLFSCIMAWGTFVPERIYHVTHLTKQIRAPYEAVQAANIHHALVMIKPFNHKGWVFGNRNSAPTFTDDIEYCRYADTTSNRRLMNYFKDRDTYVLHFDATQNEFNLVPYP